MKRLILGTGLLIIVAASASLSSFGQQPPATPQAKEEVDEKTIRALIAQLGEESFKNREDAHRKLIAIGRPALALLRKAAMDTVDAEVRERATQAVRAIRSVPGPGFWYPEANVFDIAFSKDGQSMAVGCADGGVRVYDAKTGALRHALKGHSATVYSVAFSADGKKLASCGGRWWTVFDKALNPGEIIIWDLGNGTPETTWKGSVGSVCSIALSADGKKLYAIGGDGTIRMWDIATRTEIAAGSGHDGPVRRITLAPDGKLLASAGMDGNVRFWHADTLVQARQVFAHPDGVGTLTFSPDGKYLITVNRANAPPVPGAVKVWDMTTLVEKTTIKGHTTKVLSLAVSPDSKLLAVGGGLNQGFGELKVFDLATGAERVSFEGHKEWVESATFSPDGNWLASGGGFSPGGRGELRVWDMKRLVGKGE